METIITITILAVMAVAIVALQTFGEKPLSKEAIEALVKEVIERREKERAEFLVRNAGTGAVYSSPRGAAPKKTREK